MTNRSLFIRKLLLRTEGLFAIGFALVLVNSLRGTSFIRDLILGIVALILAMVAYGAVAANSERQARAGITVAFILSVLWCIWMLVRLAG